MFALNIALGFTQWRLLFKTDESLKTAELQLTNPGDAVCIFKDDFGQAVRLRADAIQGVMIEDLDKTKIAHIELFMHQKRTEALAVKQAQSDPGLRQAQMSGGPAILTPMGNGSRPF